MPVSIERGVAEWDLARIVQDIFQAMLGLEVEISHQPPTEEPGTAIVTASMHLGGTWNGAVLLQCPLWAACGFSAALTGIERPKTADADVRDAMGELINMVAGNFKGLLGGTHLSLPTVVEGQDYRFRILRGQQTAQVCIRTPEGPAYVSLVELENTARAVE